MGAQKTIRRDFYVASGLGHSVMGCQFLIIESVRSTRSRCEGMWGSGKLAWLGPPV